MTADNGTTETVADSNDQPDRPSNETSIAKPSVLRDFSMSAVVAGLVAVIVSFAGPFVIVLAAADAGGLTDGQTSSWVWAIAVGSGITALGLSWWTRQPIITAWSTPGAALLVTALSGYSWPQAVGAFLLAALAMTIVGATGLFGRLLAKVPAAVVSAMLAGILFPFATDGFVSVKDAPWIALPVLVVFFLLRRLLPRWAVLGGLLAGIIGTAATHEFGTVAAGNWLAAPVFTAPEFSLPAVIGLAIPLFIVTAASQNAPGLAVLRVSGYVPNDRLLITSTGAASAILAPFGAHALNLAAITAAICTGEEAHEEPRRRYVAGIFCGIFYIVVGLAGGGLVAVFASLPHALVAAVAAVALLGALTSGLVGAMETPSDREAALVTFAVTATGVTVFHIGAAFWGLIAGVLVHLILTARTRRSASA